MLGSDDVLQFWLKECSPSDWYAGGDDLDARIRARFEGLWHRAMAGELCGWTTSPEGTLALIVLCDQFPRNMFRGTGQAFASDPLARATAKKAIERGFDKRIAGTARQFFYMPLEHSECLADQERAVRMMATRMEDSDGGGLLHARAHREIIRRFGRFPFRNTALGRESTGAEAAFLTQGGYMQIVNALQSKAA